MTRVITVKSSRKPLKCEKCGDTLPVKSPYRWWKFNFTRFKHVRCMKPECSPKGSDLTQSEYDGRVSDLQDFTFTGTSKDALEGEMEEVKDQIEELRDEQEEKRNNMPESLQESDSGTLLQDRYDNCDNTVTELEGVDIEDFDEEAAKEEAKSEGAETEDAITQAVGEKQDEHWESIRSALADALSSLS